MRPDVTVDAGLPDAHHADAADAARPDATRDAGHPPTGDFACTAPWSSPPAMADPRCAGVRTTSLVETGTVTLGGVTIARTAAGRLGVAYDDIEDQAQGVHLATFLAPTTSATPLAPSIVPIGYGVESHVGQASGVGAGGPADVLHVAYVDEDVDELHYVQVVDGGATPTPFELIASGIGTGAYVRVGVTSTGVPRAAYFVPSLGAIRSAARSSPGGFGASSEVVTGLAPGPPGVGQLGLFLDAEDTANLLYDSAVVQSFASPMYATFDGTGWSNLKTVENDALIGFAGYSPSVVASGATKSATYFFIPGGQSAPFVAELHLASWQSYEDEAYVSILVNEIPASDVRGTTLHPRFQASLAVDPFGLLHIVLVHPYPQPAFETVEYLRQAVVPGGVEWLTDVVDDDVLGDLDGPAPDAFAAIVVDDEARPHIAYRSGKDGNVYYATRFDRSPERP